MAIARHNIAELDPVWHRIRQEAEAAINAEPLADVAPSGHGTDADAGEYLQS